jgi:hypothetical protein
MAAIVWPLLTIQSIYVRDVMDATVFALLFYNVLILHNSKESDKYIVITNGITVRKTVASMTFMTDGKSSKPLTTITLTVIDGIHMLKQVKVKSHTSKSYSKKLFFSCRCRDNGPLWQAFL